VPKTLRFPAAGCLLAAFLVGAGPTPSHRDRLTSFYTGWFARIPGTHVSV